MSVQLPPKLEAIITRKVEAGLYRDTDEALSEAIRLLDERDRRARLLAALAEGEKGEGIPYTPELLAEINREVDLRFDRGATPNPDVCP